MICQDCAALVAGDNNEWVCDECQKPCAEVDVCPEGLSVIQETKMLFIPK